MSTNLRPAAVAAMFYPESGAVLARQVAQMLAAAPRALVQRPKAIIVPHAGYVYSGPIAASIYAPLAALRNSVRRIVLLGPTHRVAITGLAVPSSSAFATPLGNVPVDQEALAALVDLPQVVVDDAAHADEHSLEVQLPFLQTIFGEFSLLPFAVGQASPEEVAEVLDRLWGGDETLIVISSDLSHYHDYTSAKQLDKATSAAIEQLQYEQLGPDSACGKVPVSGLLKLARAKSLTIKAIDLRNSGDTAGDKSSVVGYGAYVID